jgi:aryl carrier-like protein
MLQPVGPGVVGELYLAGEGLAQGYLNAPAQTAERFLPDPWNAIPGTRMYRTGDLGRANPDGSIGFVGRIDRQLKVRGHRIEPAEVESALRAIGGIRNAVVTCSVERNETHLKAYLVIDHKASLDADAVLSSLRSKIADVAVPRTLHQVEQIPLTPNGKTDFGALESTPTKTLTRSLVSRAPKTPIEARLFEIWQQVIPGQPFGVTDTFFQVGGDSLRAVDMVGRCKAAGYSLDLADVFLHPTIRELASILVAEPSHTNLPDAIPSPTQQSSWWPLTDNQSAMWAASNLGADAPYVFSLQLHLHARLDPSTWQKAWATMRERHIALRSGIEVREGVLSQVIQSLDADEFDVTFVDLGALDSATSNRTIATSVERARRQAGSLGAVRLLIYYRPAPQSTETSIQVTLVGHHAVLDGASRLQALEELVTLALRNKAPTPGNDEPILRHAAALEQHAQTAPRTIDYWKGELARLHPGQHQTPLSGPHRRLNLSVAPDEYEALIALSRLSNCSMKTALLTVAVRATAILRGVQPLLLGVVSDGRPAMPGAAQALGAFARVQVLVVDPEAQTPLELA